MAAGDGQIPVSQKPLKNAVFMSMLLSPSVFSPLFSQFCHSFMRDVLSVSSHSHAYFCETSGFWGGEIFHIGKKTFSKL